MNGLSFVDLFCGAGGSSTGLVGAGYTLRLAITEQRRLITEVADLTQQRDMAAYQRDSARAGA